MALSLDEAYLYVGLDGAWSVARLNLATSAVDLTSFVGLDPFLPGPTLPASISVSPSDSTTVAVRINPNVQPNDELVTIYQQGVMLPNITNHGNTVALCSSGSVLYGFDNQISGTFLTMSVNATGVQQTGSASGLIGGVANIICDNNVVYASTGYVVDPLSNTQLGVFSGLLSPGGVAVDDSNQKVFYSGVAVEKVQFRVKCTKIQR